VVGGILSTFNSSRVRGAVLQGVHDVMDPPLFRNAGITQTCGISIFSLHCQSQNRAIAKLYEADNKNPLAGCVTSLVQSPICFGLYGIGVSNCSLKMEN
jgi:hypothetical protein